MTKLIAYKARWLVEASYRLTLQEQRLLLCCIGKTDPEKDFPKSITISADEFYSQFPDMGRGNAEMELMGAVDKLWGRSIIVKDPTQTEEFRWVQKRIKYHQGEAKITICFSDDVIKYLTQLPKPFARIDLAKISDLRSTHSIRIYELCMQFWKAKNRLITVEDFRFLLGVGDSYSQFKILNRDLIQPSIRELNAKSNLYIEVVLVKKGRNIHALHFHFHKKEQLEMSI